MTKKKTKSGKRKLVTKKSVLKAAEKMQTKSAAEEKKKPAIGIFSFTGCDGCQLELINREEILLDLAKEVDIIHFPLTQENNNDGPYDIAIVEGGITKKEDIQKIKDVREKSKCLIAIGSCAIYGGVPAMKNFLRDDEPELTVYSKTGFVDSIPAAGIGKYVKVDFNLRGCPPNKDEFIEVVKQVLLGKTPKESSSPVCVECKQNKNPCFLLEKEFCLGPLTYSGCDAICINNGVPCEGCRGPLDDANIAAEVKLLKTFGMTEEDVKEKARLFSATAKKYEEIHAPDLPMIVEAKTKSIAKAEKIKK